MSCISILHCPSNGNNLTVNSTNDSTVAWTLCPSFLALCRLFALAIAPPVLQAQDWDHLNVRAKIHDPTGAWLIRNDSEGSPFILTVFHEGGTLTGDVQGESAFLAGSPPPLNVINSPESGVWKKTGAKTFAVTFLTIEYQVTPPTPPLNQFDKVQFTGF